MYLNAHCRAIFMSDLDSWDSVDAKNGLTHLDWTPDTRDTKCVLKWVLVRIAAFCCAHWPQIWIPETEYYQKLSSHAQIGPQGAEKQLRKVRVGGWWVGGCKVQKPEQLLLHDEQSRAEQSARRSLSIFKVRLLTRWIGDKKDVGYSDTACISVCISLLWDDKRPAG